MQNDHRNLYGNRILMYGDYSQLPKRLSIYIKILRARLIINK
jgi:hypothetical protein